jgi:hypothetical protein
MKCAYTALLAAAASWARSRVAAPARRVLTPSIVQIVLGLHLLLGRKAIIGEYLCLFIPKINCSQGLVPSN